MDKLSIGNYETIASEYYDPVLHPTCANFREASSGVIYPCLKKYVSPTSTLCEVGAGMSLAAEWLVVEGCSLDRLTLIDSSPTMLEYSRKWLEYRVCLKLGDAHNMPLPSESIDVLVSSLGDPYNTSDFWGEVQRVLRQNGTVIYTTPSFEWATTFRSTTTNEEMITAAFILKNGQEVRVPSFIYHEQAQIALIERHGLQVKEIVQMPFAALKSDGISPKLDVLNSCESSVVTGYIAGKLV